jgi:hypothetical protein
MDRIPIPQPPVAIDRAPQNYSKPVVPECRALPPFETVPVIGNSTQGTIGYFCGINNTVASITEGGIRLYKELEEKFEIQPHLMHSDSLAGGLTMVGIEKLDKYIDQHPITFAIIGGLLDIPAKVPKIILHNSNRLCCAIPASSIAA